MPLADRAPFAGFLAELAGAALRPALDPERRQLRHEAERGAERTEETAVEIAHEDARDEKDAEPHPERRRRLERERRGVGSRPRPLGLCQRTLVVRDVADRALRLVRAARGLGRRDAGVRRLPAVGEGEHDRERRFSPGRRDDRRHVLKRRTTSRSDRGAVVGTPGTPPAPARVAKIPAEKREEGGGIAPAQRRACVAPPPLGHH